MRKLLLILCVFTLMSCTKEVKISQLVFNKSLTVAYYDEEPFSGKAWSEDNKTVCMTFEEGKIGIVINSTLGEQYVKKSSTSSTD